MFVSLAKLEIAETQLFRAITLYMSQEDLISAITLAGAADEILGNLNRLDERTAALDDDVASLTEIYRLAFNEEPNPKKFAELRNKARNDFKHLGENEVTTLDLEFEAHKIIHRAARNYQKLKPGYNKAIWEFQREIGRRL